MRSTRLKIGVAISLVALVAGLGFFVTRPSFAHPGSIAKQPWTITKGHLTKRATGSNLFTSHSARPGKANSSAASSKRTMPFRSTKRANSGAASQRGLRPAPSISTPVSTTRAALQNFNGVSSLDSAAVNGFDLEPPDQGLCEGAGLVLEPVNLAIDVFTTQGVLLTGPVALNVVFGESASEFLSDPRCSYDAANGVFYMSILAIDPSGTSSHQDVAVLPVIGPETVFSFDTTDASGFGCPCFGDQPLLGQDSSNVYISTNEFGLSTSAFNGAQIYAIDKAVLVAGGSPNVVHYGGLSIGGSIAASVQPATNPAATTEYFLNSLDPNGTFDNRLGVWAITNPGVVHSGGTPVLSDVVITSEVYGLPVGAASPGGVTINADDDRMQQVQSFHGALWGSLDTAITISGDTGERDAAAWFAIVPTLDVSGTVIASARIWQQGYVATAGQYLLYPAIEVGANGVVALTMSMTSPLTYPSAVYTTRATTLHTTWGVITNFGPGATADHGFTCSPCRWGDYSAAVMDDTSGNIWIATEYIPGSGDAFANWGTRVAEIKG